MAQSASAIVDRKSIRSRAGFTIVWIASGAPSFLPELIDQLFQLGLMLPGLELFAALFCLFAKPVLEILVGLFLLFRSDVATWHTVESETAASCRDDLKVLRAVWRCKVQRSAALSMSGCAAMMAL